MIYMIIYRDELRAIKDMRIPFSELPKSLAWVFQHNFTLISVVNLSAV